MYLLSSHSQTSEVAPKVMWPPMHINLPSNKAPPPPSNFNGSLQRFLHWFNLTSYASHSSKRLVEFLPPIW